MDFIFTYVIPVVAFILAVVSAWDRLASFAKFLSHARKAKIVKNSQRDLERIEKYSSNSALLVAYQSKQLFILLNAVLFVSLLGSPNPQLGLLFVFQALISSVLFGIAGFATGNALRVSRYVLQAEHMKKKLSERIEENGDGPNN